MTCDKTSSCNNGPGYSSPSEAVNGPREKVLFVACPCADPDQGPDAVVVIDVDPDSDNYGKFIDKLAFPNKGDEVHHIGWNACSSCYGCKNVQRSHLIFPCLNSSRIYIINVMDHKNLKIEKIIEKDELSKYDLSFPHTAHCLANGKIMISTLGDSNGNNKCKSIISLIDRLNKLLIKLMSNLLFFLIDN